MNAWNTETSDYEWQRMAELEKAGQMLEVVILRIVCEKADFEKLIEWLFVRSVSMTERYLIGLAVNYYAGLTPLEMLKQSHLQPSTIGGRFLRVKTVSMALHRLESKYLAKKVREGKTFRYFLTRSGLNDLDYRREEREKMKQRLRRNMYLGLQYLIDRRMIIETRKFTLEYQMLARKKVPGFDKSAADVMEWCVELAETVLTLKRSVINPDDQKLRSTAIAQSEQCLIGLVDRQRGLRLVSMIEAARQ